MENKKKRFYKIEELVWLIADKREAVVEHIDKTTFEVTVKIDDSTKTVKIWEIDKLKYAKAKELKVETAKKDNPKKVTYFASVNGGVVPTKDPENAGRDCYARLEPVERDGEEVFELHIPKLTLAKIPLGFASYLDKEDFLSLKHERSSIGSMGLINVSGLIDSTYQGEVILQVVPLTHDIVISSQVEEKFFDEEIGVYFAPYRKAIAQALVIRQSDAEDEEVTYEELLSKPSKRGKNGWGSTNK